MNLNKVNGGKAEIEFLLVAQNDNEAGFLTRFTTEDVVVEPAFVNKQGDVHDEQEPGDRVAARFRVVIKPKSQPASEASTTPKKKATKKTSGSDE